MNSETEISLATVDATWKIALRVWWSWPWRTLIAGVLLSMFANFWLGMFMPPMSPATAFTRPVVAPICSAVVGLYFFKDVLDRKFADFRVCVVPVTEPKSLAAAAQ